MFAFFLMISFLRRNSCSRPLEHAYLYPQLRVICFTSTGMLQMFERWGLFGSGSLRLSRRLDRVRLQNAGLRGGNRSLSGHSFVFLKESAIHSLRRLSCGKAQILVTKRCVRRGTRQHRPNLKACSSRRSPATLLT